MTTCEATVTLPARSVGYGEDAECRLLATGRLADRIDRMWGVMTLAGGQVADQFVPLVGPKLAALEVEDHNRLFAEWYQDGRPLDGLATVRFDGHGVTFRLDSHGEVYETDPVEMDDDGYPLTVTAGGGW